MHQTELQHGPADGTTVDVEFDSVMIAVDGVDCDGKDCWHEYLRDDAGRFVFKKTHHARRCFSKPPRFFGNADGHASHT